MALETCAAGLPLEGRRADYMRARLGPASSYRVGKSEIAVKRRGGSGPLWTEVTYQGSGSTAPWRYNCRCVLRTL